MNMGYLDKAKVQARRQRVGRGSRQGRLSLLALGCACGLVLLCIVQATSSVAAAGGTMADLTVTKTGDKTAPIGGQISYNIVVTNSGPDDATNVVVTDPIPEHTTFVNASVSQGSVSFD